MEFVHRNNCYCQYSMKKWDVKEPRENKLGF